MKLWTNLCKLLANQNQTNRYSSGKSGNSKRHDRRSLRLEPLEERQLLAVTTAEFDAVRAQYADLNLSANMGDYNVIEVTSLTEANLRNAITAAGNSTQNDLIVLRTTATANTITLSSNELVINIDATTKGSVTIVSLGTDKVTIDAKQLSRVLNISNSTVNLSGLVITNGQISSLTGGYGGGIYSKNSVFTICDCVISHNAVTLNAPNPAGDIYGGGIYNENGKLMIYHTDVISNMADAYGPFYFTANGGGIYNYNGKLIIKDSKICNNSVSVHPSLPNNGLTWCCGGGIYSDSNESFIIENSVISGNEVSSYDAVHEIGGGGIYYAGSSKNPFLLINSEISNNIFTAHTDSIGDMAGGGGGILGSGKMIVNNCTISGNVVDFLSTIPYNALHGGGIYSYNNALDLTLNNTIVAQNQSKLPGSVIEDDVVNRYESLNSADHRYFYSLSGNNNIIGTAFAGSSGIINGSNGNIVGTEMNPIDPKFVDPAHGNYRLQSNSPAVDAGSNALAIDANGVPLVYDLDGNPRIHNGTVDIGAFEFGAAEPMILTATPVGTKSIELSWTAVEGAASYETYRWYNGAWLMRASLPAGTTSWVQNGLGAGTTYQFQVVAKDASGNILKTSDPVSAKTLVPTAGTPENVTATPVPGMPKAVEVRWDAVPDATSYNVYRYYGTDWLLIATTSDTSYINNGLTTGSEYAFRVIAVNAAGTSLPSATVKATPQLLTPATPQNVVAAPVPNTTNKIAITWDAVLGATSYEVYRYYGTYWLLVSTTSDTSYINTGLTSGATYAFHIIALNAAGPSNPSATVKAIPG